MASILLGVMVRVFGGLPDPSLKPSFGKSYFIPDPLHVVKILRYRVSTSNLLGAPEAVPAVVHEPFL